MFASSQIALNASTPTALWRFGGSSPPQVLDPSAGNIQDTIPISIICSAAIYVGGSGVTSSNGYELPANTPLNLSIFGTSEVLYAIASTGTPTVMVLAGRQ